MLGKDLVKHGNEFARYLRNGQFEQSEQGIIFPKAGALAAGMYEVGLPGEADHGFEANTLTHEGLNYMLTAALAGGAAGASFHLSLFANNYTPVATLTASAYPATAGEITSGSEGYSESTRPQWVPGAAALGEMSNLDDRAEFTITTGTSITIRGAALLSEPIKGATTGVLVSAAKFNQERVRYAGDIFYLGYRVTLQPE